MRRSSAQKPSFFKVLSNRDFTKLLRVPPEFFGMYGLTPPGNVKLRVGSGRIWNVKVERLDSSGGLFCFTRGWPSFARHSALQLGEFLIFSLVGGSAFNVVIYDARFCERELDALCVGGGSRSSSYDKSDPLYFEICLQKHHRSRVTLRKRFLDEAGLRGKKWVMLEYAGGCASVALDPQKKWCRVDLARGWLKFRNMNRIEFGKTYSFRFNPSNNVIQVDHVVSSQDLAPMARPQHQTTATASFIMPIRCKSYLNSKLPIPSRFVRKYRQKFARQAWVTLETGDGKSWEVKLQGQNAVLYMKDGWPEFVMDNEIALLDFLTFRLTRDSAFRWKSSEEAKTRGGTGGGAWREQQPTLLRSSSEAPSHTKNPNLRDKKYVKLVNAATGNCKYVIVDPRPYRVDLALGWQGFREANGFDLGKTCSFHFIPGNNAIHVQQVIVDHA